MKTRGERPAALEVQEQVHDRKADRHVEHGRRLVGEDEAGLGRQRPGDADTLALAAGKLMGVATQEINSRHQADLVEQLFHRLSLGAARNEPERAKGIAPRCSGPSCEGRGTSRDPGRSSGPLVGARVVDGCRGAVAGSAPQRGSRPRSVARGRRPSHRECRLARAGLSHKPDHLPLLHRQVHLAERTHHLLAPDSTDGVVLGESAHLELGAGTLLTCFPGKPRVLTILGRLLAVEVAEYPMVPVKPNGRRIDRLAGAGDHLGTTRWEEGPIGQVRRSGGWPGMPWSRCRGPPSGGKQLIKAVV